VTHFDVIIIGTGAGGGTLLHRLAPTGKRILVLERGRFLPREKQNWDVRAVFHEDRYHTDEVWRDKQGGALRPSTGYWVGGNTKVYGGALFRFRERDFEAVPHPTGVSPAWPVRYADFEPYYTQAERLYQVHGSTGEDPTEPWRSAPYAHPPVSHEPRIAEIADALRARGLHPFHIPLAVQLDERRPEQSRCIRCNTCDGFPCLVGAKGDAEVLCVRPALAHDNVTLLTEAKVTRLHTSASGREVTDVEVEHGGETMRFRGDVVVVACGAINSAALLLRSASDRHPRGLGNSSDQVGRNFMKHHKLAMLAVSKHENPTVFQKTLAVNDWYWGEEGYEHPMGHVQLLGKFDKDMLALEAPGIAPGFALDAVARRAVAWWLTGEDLPDGGNRVTVSGERGETIHLAYTDAGTEGFDRLVERWKHVLGDVDAGESFLPHGLYFKKAIPLQAVGHQCGTTRFGDDPRTSVLDASCRAHDVPNLYVVDAGFFPSSAAVNPTLTIIANALRVGDLLAERLR
jgi:choline dehydrogenase-like flavoprotein